MTRISNEIRLNRAKEMFTNALLKTLEEKSLNISKIVEEKIHQEFEHKIKFSFLKIEDMISEAFRLYTGVEYFRGKYTLDGNAEESMMAGIFRSKMNIVANRFITEHLDLENPRIRKSLKEFAIRVYSHEMQKNLRKLLINQAEIDSKELFNNMMSDTKDSNIHDNSENSKV